MSCNGGRRDIINQGSRVSSEEDRDGAREGWHRELGETKAEADAEGSGEGPERVSATTFSGPET